MFNDSDLLICKIRNLFSGNILCTKNDAEKLDLGSVFRPKQNHNL